MSIEIKVPVLPESVMDAVVSTCHFKVGEAIEMDDNLNRRNQMLKDLKALPRNMKFKVGRWWGEDVDAGSLRTALLAVTTCT